jgi:hypothetical protein
MKPWRLYISVYLLGGWLASPACATDANPIEKIVALLTRLQGQLIQDGEIEAVAYEKYHAYCEEAAHNKKEEISAAQAEKDMLTAVVAKAGSDITTSTGKIEDNSASLAENEAKLKAATEIRAKDAATFQASETELMGAIDMLGKAIDILTKEMAKTGSAALLQTSAATQQLENVVMGLGAVVEGASLGASEDLNKLTAMLQARQEAEEGSDDEDGQKQEPKAYEAKSGGITEVLEDLRDKAEAQLRDIRTAEAKAVQNFDLMKQALVGETAQYKKEFDEETNAKSGSQKEKATAEGNLAITVKELAKGQEDYSGVQRDCMRKASDHEATVTGRAAELKTLAEAKKIIQAQMAGAAAASLVQTSADEVFSFLQTSSQNRLSREQMAGQHVIALVQRLAVQQKSDSLKQLASRISAVIKYGLNGSARDPFRKVKGLLSDMIAKLTKEQQGDASEQEYCDRETKKTKAKKEELADDADGLKTKIDQAASASTKLKSQVKDLQWELSQLEKLTLEMTNARNAAHKVYVKDKEDLSQGLNAIRAGIHVLRDYYAADKEDETSFIQTQSETEDGDADSDSDADADTLQQPKPPENHQKSGGAGAGIISLLEVVESNLAKNLAELQTEEDDAQTAYQKELQESRVSKATKDADVSYKIKEYTALDKSVSELSSDYATTNEELSAVNEYFAKVNDRCVAKPDKFEDRKARREEEIKGLEEAKSILDSESSSFLQRRR